MKGKKFETQAIRTQMERSQNLEHSSPIYMTSSFVFEDAEDMRASFAEEKQRNIYSRYSNPNSNELIERVCQMEGAESGFAYAEKDIADGCTNYMNNIGWSEKTQRTKSAIELNNGRAAMMGILGLAVHERIDNNPYVLNAILGAPVAFNQ